MTFKSIKLNFIGVLFDSLTFSYLAILAIIYITSPSTEQLLNITANTTYIILTIFFGVFLTLILSYLNILTLGASLFEAQHLKLARPVTPWHQTFWGWQLGTAFICTFIVGIMVTDFSFYELTDDSGFLGAKRIFTALFHPEPSILPRGILAIIETIYIAFMATVIAIPFAFILAFFSAKNIMNVNSGTLAIYFLLRTLLNITRSIEPLIWAIIFSVWVGIGPFAGMLALMFHSVASLTKQYSEIIESAEDGPIEGIRATGANSIQVVWYSIVPQVILPYIAFTIYRWDINVRMATVIGLVGGGGIGTLLIQYQGQAMWNEVGTLAILIIIIVWTMDTLSAYIREALK